MYYRDRKVVITLTAQEPVSDVLERTITLDYDRVKMPIGRSSSRVASVAPRPDNAFYENPVMSRSHAELHADLRYLRLYVRDARSSHGTLVNDTRIEPAVQHPLRDGDILTFGVAIRHGTDVIAPVRAKIGLRFLQSNTRSIGERVQGTFTVPDDDSADEEEATDLVSRAVGILHRCGVSGANSGVVDLTDDSRPPPVLHPLSNGLSLSTGDFGHGLSEEVVAIVDSQTSEDSLEVEPETSEASENHTPVDGGLDPAIDGEVDDKVDDEVDDEADEEINDGLSEAVNGVVNEGYPSAESLDIPETEESSAVEDHESFAASTSPGVVIDADATLLDLNDLQEADLHEPVPEDPSVEEHKPLESSPQGPKTEEARSTPDDSSRKRKMDEISTAYTEAVHPSPPRFGESFTNTNEATSPLPLQDGQEALDRPVKRVQTD
ncbi:unnamed protein product [Parascedosporium putredinis]|uniref:FHA domain-containing protein n=1 Tax=Parascedosporium putredinis TaxID=1442378 RepID=A0A9P1M9N5_9PEZI|nr:unnamed protein product [Parascedosporium putredinis]CAI7995963.1 unnamed protein product [Parascedosporium putredinis]